MFEIEISRLALAETDESRAWYELERANLGEEFVDEVERTVAAIQENPRQFPFYQGQVRRCVMSRFPFVIYFNINPTKIRILRVTHCKRDPGPIRDSLP